MSDHPLRRYIREDLNLLINYKFSSDFKERQVDALLENIANDLYPFLEKNGWHSWGSTKICQKCKRWNKDTIPMGDGALCPRCREQSTYKPKYVAKVVKKNGTKEYIGEVKGESISDLWGNFNDYALKKKFPIRVGSRYYSKIDKNTRYGIGPFLYIELNRKPLSLKNPFEK